MIVFFGVDVVLSSEELFNVLVGGIEDGGEVSGSYFDGVFLW